MLDPQHVTALLAAIAWKVCPVCGRLGVVRTSKRAGGATVKYLRCPDCGERFKSLARQSCTHTTPALQTQPVEP